MEHPARKITKIAREAERVVLLATRRDDVGTAEIDLIHAVRHHPGITQTELAQALHADKPAIARRTASLERKGYLRREPNPEDGRSQLLYPTRQAEGLRDTGLLFFRDRPDGVITVRAGRGNPGGVSEGPGRGLSPFQRGEPAGLSPCKRSTGGNQS